MPQIYFLLEFHLKNDNLRSQISKFHVLIDFIPPPITVQFEDIIRMLSSNPYDDLKFAILERIEGPKLEFSKWLGNELINGGDEKLQPQERDNSESDPPQTDSNGSSSTIITLKRNLIHITSILTTENTPKHFCSSLVISTLIGERRNSTQVSKYLPPTRH